MKTSSMKDMIKLSFGEELGNALTHGIAAVFYLFSLPVISVLAYIKGGVIQSLGISIYGICMFLMFLGSCIYHAMEFGSSQKYVMRKLDHSFIYLAIAGTYTPVLLTIVKGWLGVILLIVEWVMTILGIILTSVSKNYHKRLTLTLYLVMGWIAIFILPTLIANSSMIFLALIILGGIFYTIGVYFYNQKWPYAHFIWHIFIMLASIAHFIAVVFFI